MWWTDYKVGVVMKSLRAGFSLIELMIVVAIIGILAAIAIPSYQDYVARARVSEGLTMASSIKTAVTEYWIANNRWPTDATEADYLLQALLVVVMYRVLGMLFPQVKLAMLKLQSPIQQQRVQ